jgi:hypothetical protein
VMGMRQGTLVVMEVLRKLLDEVREAHALHMRKEKDRLRNIHHNYYTESPPTSSCS